MGAVCVKPHVALHRGDQRWLPPHTQPGPGKPPFIHAGRGTPLFNTTVFKPLQPGSTHLRLLLVPRVPGAGQRQETGQ